MTFTHPLHAKAIHLSKVFKRVEADLVDVLQKIDEQKIFRKMGFASLFEYTTKSLELSESVAYGLIAVSRKSRKIPELKAAVVQGELSLSQAKRITSVLTKENASELIEKAKTMTQREIEKVVATINPKVAVGERTRFVSQDRIELKMSLKEESMRKLKRIQDLESQRTKKACDLESTLEVMIEEYLTRHDPVRKSERILQKPSLRKVKSEAEVKGEAEVRGAAEVKGEAEVKGGAEVKGEAEVRGAAEVKGKAEMKGGAEVKGEFVRLRLTNDLKHRVHDRDKAQCTYADQLGRRCSNKRWIEIHHIIPVSQGGDNRLENLTTLCHSHHRRTHETKGLLG